MSHLLKKPPLYLSLIPILWWVISILVFKDKMWRAWILYSGIWLKFWGFSRSVCLKLKRCRIYPKLITVSPSGMTLSLQQKLKVAKMMACNHLSIVRKAVFRNPHIYARLWVCLSWSCSVTVDISQHFIAVLVKDRLEIVWGKSLFRFLTRVPNPLLPPRKWREDNMFWPSTMRRRRRLSLLQLPTRRVFSPLFTGSMCVASPLAAPDWTP